MKHSPEGIFSIVIIVCLMAGYFGQDWLEYECIEYAGEGANQYPSENYVSLYEKGGVSTLNKFDDTWKMKHKIIEGTKYISYVRADSDSWTFKLNKEDLSYYNRLADKSGQCIEVGFFDKLMKGSYAGFEW